MAKELKRHVINMKSLDQDIEDPVVAGGGDVNGRTLAVIFTQEAAAQLTPATKVYLKWRHQQMDTIGYNVFTKVADKPVTWEIKYPRSMLKEGDVTATIELVDDISICASTTFNIHILADPYDISRFGNNDDLTEFQRAATNLATLGDTLIEQFNSEKSEIDEQQAQIEEQLDELRQVAHDANEAADRANQIATYLLSEKIKIVEF